MKITFIQPYYENVWEALGVGYIISYIDHYYGVINYDLEINFFQGKFDNNETILEGAKDSDIVAFSCTTPAFYHGYQLAETLKMMNPKIHIVFGGWHATALPQETVDRMHIDQVIVGEGEHAMMKVVLGNREPILRTGNIRPDLPWPDRSTIRNGRCIDLCESINGKRSVSFQLNRGCKVHCKFCGEIGMTGKYNKKTNPIRTRSYNDVIDEIFKTKMDYNLNYFKFVDATFDKDAETVINFCAAKIDRGLDMPWECNIHPGFVQKEEVFAWLEAANCEQINVGCESGSPYILADVGKGTSVESIKNVFKWAETYNIKRRGYFLLGMPNETLQDYWLTEELIDEIEPDVVGFTILAPYPGSDFYDPIKHRDVDWSKVDEYSNDIWETNNFTNSQLKEFQEKFTNRYSHLLCERQV